MRFSRPPSLGVSIIESFLTVALIDKALGDIRSNPIHTTLLHPPPVEVCVSALSIIPRPDVLMLRYRRFLHISNTHCWRPSVLESRTHPR